MSKEKRKRDKEMRRLYDERSAAYTMNVASPNEKKRYLFSTA